LAASTSPANGWEPSAPSKVCSVVNAPLGVILKAWKPAYEVIAMLI